MPPSTPTASKHTRHQLGPTPSPPPGVPPAPARPQQTWPSAHRAQPAPIIHTQPPPACRTAAQPLGWFPLLCATLKNQKCCFFVSESYKTGPGGAARRGRCPGVAWRRCCGGSRACKGPGTSKRQPKFVSRRESVHDAISCRGVCVCEIQGGCRGGCPLTSARGEAGVVRGWRQRGSGPC